MIELQNVIKSYKSSNSRKVINVVDDISLSMEAGKLEAIYKKMGEIENR